MKKVTLLAIGIVLFLLGACSHPSNPDLATHTDTISWVIGRNVGLQFAANNDIKLNSDVLCAAIANAINGDTERPLTDEQYARVMRELLFLMNGTSPDSARALAAEGPEKTTPDIPAPDSKNIKQLQKHYFDSLTAVNKNVVRANNGFYYEVLKQGNGRKPRYAERVSFDYRSYVMLTGQPYDQTYGRRSSIIHVVGKPMFQGLIDGLQLMNAGSIYRFYFPYEVAFGESGSGSIPGYTPFIYEVELNEVFDE